jgi:hypothetical protein
MLVLRTGASWGRNGPSTYSNIVCVVENSDNDCDWEAEHRVTVTPVTLSGLRPPPIGVEAYPVDCAGRWTPRAWETPSGSMACNVIGGISTCHTNNPGWFNAHTWKSTENSRNPRNPVARAKPRILTGQCVCSRRGGLVMAPGMVVGTLKLNTVQVDDRDGSGRKEF